MKKTFKLLTLGLAATAIAAPAVAQDLSFWSWRQEDRAVYEDLIAAFEAANPGITVEFEAFEASSYATILSTALAGESGPDMMMVRAYGAFEAVAGADYLMPITQDDVPGLASMNETALLAQTLREDGEIYGVPFASQTMLVIYNKGIYDQLGLSEPDTWDELLANAQAIEDAGMFAFANGTATAWQNETIVSALGSSTIGQDFFREVVAGTTDFTDPRFVAGLEKVQEISAYFPDGFTGLDYASSQQLFVSGLAAMFAGGSFEIANFRNQNPDLEIGVFAAPGPSADDAKLVGVFFDGGYAGNASTEHAEAVKKFLAYTATTEFGQVFANELRNITPIQGVTLTDDLLNEVAQLNQSAVPYIMLTNFRYEEPSGSVLLQAEVQKMLAGETTPQDAAQAVTDGIATYYAPFQD
ncbi:extracellular solute-binding protein [Ponticoccus sp. SC2-23]|uniref:extracellular solute-binding protein n=1 Tax=Alexandriicola marinus TaxID=2081710 RepID=UPI000FD99F68|nr:extracellular solute-binding protein [Alexandriicola marinus]MBM1218597.1 extracellular solute-binding protein [Ponticoccus sp. SC6-9]MBM1224331.1 extracellular solute-binding protein [Ponticoccus sp. SC6-15]MBM1229890.1 extracellular solute-binding protein [Ponticoccus sp. SC6-38]MBM1233297.1 extracellular solute-binding protein [Ponticoccus sp. SC6-45]MBM1236753.1 extracellular solute-binding protein [Ponticoccus sp. SC6-49]MBM1242308.1 extracellular solute-binding protein [Ponticoccus s